MTMRPVFFILAAVSLLGSLLVWHNQAPGADRPGVCRARALVR